MTTSAPTAPTAAATPAELLASLQTRYATKQFDPTKKIDAETWQAIEQSLVLTASSFGLQPWRFIVVDSPEIREQLVPVSWNQKQVVDASHMLVLACNQNITEQTIDAYLQNTAETRQIPVESLNPMRDMMVGFICQNMDDAQRHAWAARQIYIALGNLLTTAAALGVDACPMEGIEPAAYDKILGLEDTDFSTIVACPLGFRDESDKYASMPKVRYPQTQVIHHI